MAVRYFSTLKSVASKFQANIQLLHFPFIEKRHLHTSQQHCTANMTKYKLSYFNFRGRAEPIRILLHLGGVDFEDHRWELADWPKLKPETPWGSGPVLEVDGVPLAQTSAILHYLGKKFGYSGKDDFEAAKCIELMNSLQDAGDCIRPAFMKKDETKKEEMLQKAIKEGIEPYYQRLTKVLESTGTGYFVGNGLTIADLSLYVWLEGWEDGGVVPGVLQKFSKLHEFVKRIESLPKVQEWINKRPDCPFSIVSKPKKT